MDRFKELKDWTQVFLKNRDINTQSITGFEDDKNGFVVHKSASDILFLIFPEPADINEIAHRISESVGLVILNLKRNLEWVISNWEKLAQFKQLCIYFVNPEKNEKWILYPFTHNQITEKVALRRGLEAMFAEVPPA